MLLLPQSSRVYNYTSVDILVLHPCHLACMIPLSSFTCVLPVILIHHPIHYPEFLCLPSLLSYISSAYIFSLYPSSWLSAAPASTVPHLSEIICYLHHKGHCCFLCNPYPPCFWYCFQYPIVHTYALFCLLLPLPYLSNIPHILNFPGICTILCPPHRHHVSFIPEYLPPFSIHFRPAYLTNFHPLSLYSLYRNLCYSLTLS